MNGPRHQFLARARFAKDQHRAVRGRDLAHCLADLLHRGAIAGERTQITVSLCLAAQVLDFLPQTALQVSDVGLERGSFVKKHREKVEQESIRRGHWLRGRALSASARATRSAC